jgi:hypothetical protein
MPIVTDNGEIELGKAFDRAIALVGVCSVGFVTFDQFLPVSDLFTIPGDIERQNHAISRIVWIVSSLIIMYFTKYYKSRSYARTLYVSIALFIISSIGMAGAHVISRNYVIQLESASAFNQNEAVLLVRPFTLSDDIKIMTDILQTDNIHEQNVRIISRIGDGSDGAITVENYLRSRNQFAELVYRICLFFGTSFVFVGILLMAWTLIVIPTANRPSRGTPEQS